MRPDGDRPLRIALFTDTYVPQMNGVAKTLSRWRDAMSARGHDVVVFTTTVPGEAETERVRRFPSVPFWAYKEMRLALSQTQRSIRELQAFRPDVIHCATPFGVGLSGRSAALRLGVPMVSSYHTSFAQYAKYYRMSALERPGMAYLRWFHNSGRRTFVPTLTIARELESAGFRDVSLWSRGLDASRFNPGYRDAALRSAVTGASQPVIVSYVGRLAAEKGVDVAATAMSVVARRRPQAFFAAAGDGPDEARVRKLAPPRSWFAGRLSGDSLSAFYASSDIFVFPSTTDTFGNVLLEAMGAGLAIVAADVPQSREVVGTDAGVFATAGDSDAFANAITSLIDDRERLDAMRRAALTRARQQSWDAVFDGLVNDYRTAMQSTPRPSQARHLFADAALL